MKASAASSTFRQRQRQRTGRKHPPALNSRPGNGSGSRQGSAPARGGWRKYGVSDYFRASCSATSARRFRHAEESIFPAGSKGGGSRIGSLHGSGASPRLGGGWRASCPPSRIRPVSWRVSLPSASGWPWREAANAGVSAAGQASSLSLRDWRPPLSCPPARQPGRVSGLPERSKGKGSAGIVDLCARLACGALLSVSAAASMLHPSGVAGGLFLSVQKLQFGSF